MGAPVTDMVAVPDFVGSVTDVAVIVAEPDVAGAVKVVAVPLAVVVGLKDPQVPLQLHVTPAFAESLETVAVAPRVPFTLTLVAVVLTDTEIAGGGGGVELLPDEHATSAASIIIARAAVIAWTYLIVHLRSVSTEQFFADVETPRIAPV